MSSQVKKNTINPKGILYHHSLIKILILDQLKERNQSWDTFVFKVLNPHLISENALDISIIMIPVNPHP